MASVVIFSALFLVCVLYAAVLHRTTRYYADGWVWLTVVIGFGLCLAAAWINAHYTGMDGLQSVLISFVVGGAPIVTWQLWRLFWLWPRQARRTRRDR